MARKTTETRWEHCGFVIRKVGDKYQVDYGQRAGKRERVRAETLDAAKLLASQHRDEMASLGLSARALSPHQRADAVAALATLSDTGATLAVAATFYRDHHRPADQSVTVAAAVPQYLDALRKEGARPAYVAGAQVRTRRLAADIGTRSMAAITRDDVAAWLDVLGLTPANRLSFIRVLSPLWTWAIDRGLASTNPWRELKKPKLDARLPTVATPAEVKAVMKAAKKHCPDAVAGWAVLFFAGLRPTEAMRLTWADVDLGARVIRVGGATSKTRSARLVPITDNLACWLAGRRPSTGGSLIPSRTTWIRRRRKVLEKARITMGPDVPRHSFASYRLAATGDEARTALECGHSAAVLHRFYKQLATEATAREYFAIAPRQRKKKGDQPAKGGGNLLHLPTTATA